MDHDFDTTILDAVAHRPWRMPARPWLMTQTWHDLLFAHWAVDPEGLKAHVPPEFPVDVFDGRAWVGIVPFRLTNVAPRGVPSLPWISEFCELNVRTYVNVGGRPGVYFFSLDAGSSIAARAARALLNLPYYPASMTAAIAGGVVAFTSRRTGAGAARFRAEYQPAGSTFAAADGSLEYFLTERYCLYHRRRNGAPYRLDIHHPPWPLQPATGRLMLNTMAAANGLALPDEPPLLHFASRQDMVAWAPVALR